MTSCTIIITEPNVAKIHNRMPVILDPENYDAWLSSGTSPEEAKKLLQPYSGPLTAYPVPKAVGQVKNDDPSLIEEARV